VFIVDNNNSLGED
jgi:hypothetical protein